MQRLKKLRLKKIIIIFVQVGIFFQARLDAYVSNTNRYFESAVIGEIGNNTFDHNWEYEKRHVRGAYFNTDNKRLIILVDFGQGLRNSLSSVRKINSDLEAVIIAFTERLSGRAPEQRGNGLKFVCDAVKEKIVVFIFSIGQCLLYHRRRADFLF